MLGKRVPDGSNGKESGCNAGDLVSISGLGRCPGEVNGNPLQYSCLEKPHGQRSLVGCSPWGLKDSDITEVTEYACISRLRTSQMEFWLEWFSFFHRLPFSCDTAIKLVYMSLSI